MEWLTKLDVRIVVALIAVAASAAGWGFREWYVTKWSERRRAIGDLLQNYAAVSSVGMRRLEGEAREALRRWREKSVPPTAGVKIHSIGIGTRVLCRYVYEDGVATSCPGLLDGFGQPLWVKLQAQTHEEAVRELESVFADLAQTWPLSDKLLSTIKIPEQALIWVTAPKLKLRNTAEATAAVDALNRSINTRLVTARPVLEAPINGASLDGFRRGGSVVLLPAVPPTFANSHHAPDAVRYAHLRDRADAYLAPGAHFGSGDEGKPHLVPAHIVEAQYRDEFKRIFDAPWSLLRISGPPGSCKTSFVSALAGHLRKGRAITIDATRAVVKALSQEPEKAKVESILQLLTAAAAEAPSVPAEFRVNDVTIEALRDSLFDTLRSAAQPAVLLFDDLEAARDARAILPHVYRLLCERGIRLVVAGRTTTNVGGTPDDRVFSLTTKLVDRTTAQEILRVWLRRDPVWSADEILRRGAFAEKTSFSTHLLRLAAEHVEDVSATSSALLKKKLDLYIAPMTLRLGTAFFAPRDASAAAVRVLHTLKGQIISGASAEELMKTIDQSRIEKRDLTVILGTLAWSGRFEQGDLTLDADSIVKWSQRFAITAEEARALLDAGAEAGVFRAGAPEWLDKMVADGFGALHLPQAVDGGEPPAVIAEMVRTLQRTNSIDVLSLALDPHVLLRLISVALEGIGPDVSEPSAAHSSTLVEAIDKLITPEVLARLHGTNWADRIAQSVWAAARGVPFPQLVPVCRVLEKLARVSSKVALLCEQYLTIADFDESARALGVRAIQHVDRPSLFSFSTVQPHRENAARAAAHIWTSAGAAALLGEIRSWATPRAAQEIWSVWCQRQDLDTLGDLIEGFLAMPAGARAATKLLTQLLAATFEAAIAPNPHTAARHGFADVAIMQRLLTSGRNTEASAVAPWIMHARLPDVVSPKTPWWVDPSGKFLLSAEPLRPLPVGRIFALLRDDGSAWLPSRAELGACGASGPELVRDGFPPAFRGEDTQAFPAASYQLLAAPGETQFIDIRRIREPVSWRPCVVLG